MSAHMAVMEPPQGSAPEQPPAVNAPQLTLLRTDCDRSLQRRWLLDDAAPLTATPLRPANEFIPADLRIWWRNGDGRDLESFKIHAWPTEKNSRDFASWDGTPARCPATIPAWVQDLSKGVRADLAANTVSTNSGVEDRWGYTSEKRWAVEGAAPVPDLRRSLEFVPRTLSIWWSFNVGCPERENRLTVYARPSERDYSHAAQWSGTPVNPGRDMPAWIQELVEAQYEELAATAHTSTSERQRH